MRTPRRGRPLAGGNQISGVGVPSGPDADTRPLLYAVACGSPASRHLDRLVTLAHRAGWRVAVVATPSARAFIDAPALAAQTGSPVRSEFPTPGADGQAPAADAVVVAPATVNTVNKWACGIADTLALSVVVEAHGRGVPMVAVPFTNSAMAAHPAFRSSLRRLSSWGVRVLFGDDVIRMPAPGWGATHASRFPWRLPIVALGPPRPAEPPAAAAPAPPRPVRAAPPPVPRHGPAIRRR